MHTLDDIKSMRVYKEISPKDNMFEKLNEAHYFYVGRSNLWAIMNALNIRKSYAGGDSAIERIFDFGCGHGRVTRYIRAGFPSAEIFVTDYDRSGVAFCCEKFNCRDTDGQIPEDQFDLVHLGSVFTHLPAHIVRSLLANLLKSLRPNGVLIFTTQGRYSAERMRGVDWNNSVRPIWMHYNLKLDLFSQLLDLYDKTGYGYVDYPHQTDYGVCIARPEWYAREALRSNDFIQIFFQEKGCENHQDVSAFMRANLIDHRKGPLW